ncbi:hypothetical protein CEXT_578321 [Caerostris extrusa]|uniref:Uncharacterized protein n=1 Tax=Caerostris extrusa TaxID=172846 RepID=A0AAV4R488_CAEEX|nr:hypothetical protein CEXT_578321 [Caerostris extrusa]
MRLGSSAVIDDCLVIDGTVSRIQPRKSTCCVVQHTSCDWVRVTPRSINLYRKLKRGIRHIMPTFLSRSLGIKQHYRSDLKLSGVHGTVEINCGESFSVIPPIPESPGGNAREGIRNIIFNNMDTISWHDLSPN